ncbi:2-dehydropantoate 2-reductase [Psychrosphaera sp. B3R10]|uniref:ketopantoate reductase family protein n=1 Tax=unclassified Psychrosphaera TaxID=2641570 RepID=UPI001C09B4C1|nr:MULTISPECIES: 2-dehydropantoate 2-reductase [unclassified Psychrosphaera]MBU2881582.1 2-dehydropantoate 2-reductase [Psychrosphaera sp. I2R16]MBU2991163.1 2-dehydropantoate 2-reductase [Psychrosphaera sp. B3R10]
MPNNRDWHFVGQGAISSFCAVNVLPNHAVTVLTRRSSVSEKTFIDLQGQQIRLPLPRRLRNDETINNLVVAVKAYDIVNAIADVIGSLADDANVVLCHNGMGTIPDVLELLQVKPNCNVYFCTTSSGVNHQGNNIILAAIGQSQWQSIVTHSPHSALNINDFKSLFLVAEQAEELPTILWQKLIINCAINPLTAINRVTNGELAAQTFQQQLNTIVAEVINVARIDGVDFDLNTMIDLVNSVIKSTAKNYSSMYQDLTNNRKTEIDFINGYVCKLANQYKIDVPVNQALVRQIQKLGG